MKSAPCFFNPTFLLSIALLWVHCIQPSTGGEQAGNISQTGNSIIGIHGVLFESDGVTPAQNATVAIEIQKAAPAGTSILAKSAPQLSKSGNDVFSTVTSDESGKFRFDDLVSSDFYRINAQRGDTVFAMIDWIVPETIDSVPSIADTLKKPASITGVVAYPADTTDIYFFFVIYLNGNIHYPSQGPDHYDPSQFPPEMIYNYELNGKFSIHNIAEGEYDLIIEKSFHPFLGLRKESVKVRAGEVTDLDTLRLPLSPIPDIPVSPNCDSTSRIVTLSWAQPDTTIIKGVNIYGDPGPGIADGRMKLNQSPVTDTFFVDSSFANGLRKAYPALPNGGWTTYMVQGVDREGNEGSGMPYMAYIPWD